ncbi:MAG: trypsin-like peptidase domain-containing protein, partial [Candidatus Riflebacteria bacterium]|nr:trypsin-like peptidase domain-containing protein [Candidatus Riflebacteria bacterium]
IGTGFYALEPDIIVTCYHVVEGATNITAKTSKGDIVSIEGIIDYSEEKDIALLKASSKNSTLLELQANMPTPGTPAYVLGSPKGLDFSFSDGVISQIRRGKETL